MSATNRGSIRAPNDLYETPPWLVNAILEECVALLFPNHKTIDILEPAAGSKQNIVNCIKNFNWENPINLDYGDILTGQDFFTHDYGKKYDLIITNPPYNQASEFIARSFELLNENGYLALLLRLNFLGSQKRAIFLRENPPISLFVTPKRPKFSVNKKGKLGSDATEYAWFLWEKTRGSSSPRIHILRTEDL